MLPTPGGMIGKYRLVEKLGAGGMAEVWLAKSLGVAGFERTVVVKRILSHLVTDEGFVQMFVSEAKLSALLHHPNIVQILEFGEEQGEFYMALEHIDGFDLRRVLQASAQQGQPLPLAFVASVVRDLCRGLSYAHELTDDRGQPLHIVHRDVSPSNILIGRRGAVKLLDFGVAKALGASSDERSRTGTLTGKVGYMSPEQAGGKRVDARSDQFSVGIILHELLVLRRLFKGQSEFETLDLVRQAEVLPPSHYQPEVPAGLDGICLRALQRERTDRFDRIADLADALEPFATGWTPHLTGTLLAQLFSFERELSPVPVVTLSIPSEASTHPRPGEQEPNASRSAQRPPTELMFAPPPLSAARSLGLPLGLPALPLGNQLHPGGDTPTSDPGAPSRRPAPWRLAIALSIVGLVAVGVGLSLRRTAAPPLSGPTPSRPVPAAPTPPAPPTALRTPAPPTAIEERPPTPPSPPPPAASAPPPPAASAPPPPAAPTAKRPPVRPAVRPVRPRPKPTSPNVPFDPDSALPE